LGQFLHTHTHTHTHMAASQRWMSAADLRFFRKKLMVHICSWFSPSIVHDSAHWLTQLSHKKETCAMCHPSCHIVGAWSTTLAPWRTHFWNG